MYIKRGLTWTCSAASLHWSRYSAVSLHWSRCSPGEMASGCSESRRRVQHRSWTCTHPHTPRTMGASPGGTAPTASLNVRVCLYMYSVCACALAWHIYVLCGGVYVCVCVYEWVHVCVHTCYSHTFLSPQLSSLVPPTTDELKKLLVGNQVLGSLKLRNTEHLLEERVEMSGGDGGNVRRRGWKCVRRGGETISFPTHFISTLPYSLSQP